MNEEFDNDEILEAELADDALEKTMKKAENEAARILKQSSQPLTTAKKSPVEWRIYPKRHTIIVNCQDFLCFCWFRVLTVIESKKRGKGGSIKKN